MEVRYFSLVNSKKCSDCLDICDGMDFAREGVFLSFD